MARETYDYLILGNGAAAVNGVEAIRRLDAAGSIGLVARESEHAYSRPLITYRLAGAVDDAGMDYRGREFYRQLAVEARLGAEAASLETARRQVRLRDGTALGFGKLLIATGGAPIRPPIEGSDTAGVFTFTTWADERAVDEWIGRHDMTHGAVVLGGGLIGLKCVEALSARKVPTTVVELADRILPVTFDHDASRLAEAQLARHGVSIRTNATIRKVVSTGGAISAAVLSDGLTLNCDMLIMAIGVRPDLALVQGTAVKVERGILVDERMESSVAGIFAAGDVAQGLESLTGRRMPIPILPVAARQGRVAGTNMAGGEARFDGGLAMNAVDVVGLPTISVGQTVELEGDEVLRRLDERAGTYRKLVLRDGRIVGVILIGQIERAGILTGLIRSRVDVSGLKHLLLTDQFGLLSLPADYRAHMVSGMGIEV